MSRRLPTWSLGWLVPALILLARPAAAGDVCAIVETTGGDSTMADAVASLLEQHGVETRSERCGASRAHVLVDESEDPTSITVSIRDGEGKKARRQIERNEKTTAVVASLVESFILGEDADLLLRPGAPGIEERTTTVAPAPRRFGQVSLLGGFMLGADSSTWYGAQLDGCVRAAGNCIGLRARFAQDDQGDKSDLVRSQWGASALWGIPFEGQRWQLMPAFALGVTYTRSSRFPAPFFRVSATDYDLRGQLSLGLALFLSASWAVRLDLAGEVAIALSHTSRRQDIDLDSLLVSLVPEPPGPAAWLALGLEYRR